jgi:hypothetical protein
MECSIHVDDGEPHVATYRNVERGIDLMPHARWKVCGDKIQPPSHFVDYVVSRRRYEPSTRSNMSRMRADSSCSATGF